MDLGPSIRDLAKLLEPPKEDSDIDDEFKPTSGIVGPGSIGPSKVESGNDERSKLRNTDDIWNAKEVTEGAELDDIVDSRIKPEYEMVFKQRVSTEDVYLQLGNKGPATFSCEDLVVKIKLPGTRQREDINIDIKEQKLDCRTPIYRLGLFLPHPVNPNQGKAEWDQKSSLLTVTLRLDREFDDFNF